MTTPPIRVDLLFAARCEVGESPCWDARKNRLLWVDILRGSVFAGNPGTGAFELFHQSDRPVGAVRPANLRTGPGFVLAEQGRLTLLSSEGTVVARIPAGPADPHTRANDAEPDPKGRLLVGTMAMDGAPGAGVLHSVQPDGGATAVLDGLAVPNGMAWSPDGSRLYFIDSHRRAIDMYEYDQHSGRVGAVRRHCDLSSIAGVPDGMAMDDRGFLYVAIFDAGLVLVVDRKGGVVSSITVPARQVTSCAFGDPDRRALYITTASYQLTPEQAESEPASGGVFRVRLDARGAHRYAYNEVWPC